MTKFVLPIVQVNDDKISFMWDSVSQTIEFEMSVDGQFDWYYRNRTYNVVDGSEESVYTLPHNFFEYLNSVLNSFPD